MGRLTLGELAETQVDNKRQQAVARELGQPIQLWQTVVDKGMFALNDGRLDEARALIADAYAIGERAIPELALPAFVFQSYLLADFRGGLGLVETEMQRVIALHPGRRVFACALAHIHARLLEPEAGSELDELAGPGFSQLLFDQEWLLAASLLAETAALTERRDHAPPLYDAILPYAELAAVDLPEGTRGSMSRYLGQLATLLERWDDAEKHYEEASAANARMGSTPWVALTRRDHAAMLRARGEHGDRSRADELEAAAHATFRELEMGGYG